MTKTLTATNDQSNLEFHGGMVARMEAAYHSYGDYRNNYKGRYKKAFLKDVEEHLGALVSRWKQHVPETTNANCNAVLAAIERLKLYVVGGTTKGGEVGPGNTEYLMDSSNFEMIEYSFPQVPKARFEATDYLGSPGSCGEGEGEIAIAAACTYGDRRGD